MSKKHSPSSSGSISTCCLLMGREVGVLPQRVPTNSERMRAKACVQHEATRNCVDVIHADNDARIPAAQKCCPIFKFNYFVIALTGQGALAHTNIAQLTNCRWSLAHSRPKVLLYIT